MPRDNGEARQPARRTIVAAIVMLCLLGLLLSQLAFPPRTMLPPGMTSGWLLVRLLEGDFPRDKRIALEHRWTAYDLGKLSITAGPVIEKSIVNASRETDIYWKSQKIGRGYDPVTSADGRLAYTASNQRHIIVIGQDGLKRAYATPRVRKVAHLQWSPKGDMLLYCYPHSTFLYALSCRVSSIWGVALLDLASGRNYRVFPTKVSGGEIRGVSGWEVRWVAELTEPAAKKRTPTGH